MTIPTQSGYAGATGGL